MRCHPTSLRRESGSSLVLVLLIAIVAISAVYSSVTLTYDHFYRTKMERDVTIAQLNAEEVFSCVRYWVNLNPDYFSTSTKTNDSGVYTYEVWTDETDLASSTFVGEYTGYGTSSECIQTRLDFITPTHGETYVSDGNYATSTFTVGRLRTVVVRDLSSEELFDGNVYVYSRTDHESGPFLAERYQRHWYRVGVKGADVMFVIDRSGSIGGKRNNPAASTFEWRELMLAVTETISRFDSAYNIRFGVTTFSTGDSANSGIPVPPDANCPNPAVSCLQEPDIPLTDVLAELPSAGVLHDDPIDDTWANIRTLHGFTNISYGIAAAGAELMNKYYPAGGASQWGDFTAAGMDALIPGRAAGWMEFAISEGIDLEATLVDKPVIDVTQWGDRTPDTAFPDYIFLITDGEPNQVPASTTTTGYLSGVPAALDAVDPCFMASTTMPIDIGFTATYGVAGDLVEKCNATLVKRTLNRHGIKFGVIGVGVSTKTERWLSDTMSDLPYVRATGYGELQQAIAVLFGGIALLELR